MVRKLFALALLGLMCLMGAPNAQASTPQPAADVYQITVINPLGVDATVTRTYGVAHTVRLSFLMQDFPASGGKGFTVDPTNYTADIQWNGAGVTAYLVNDGLTPYYEGSVNVGAFADGYYNVTFHTYFQTVDSSGVVTNQVKSYRQTVHIVSP